MNHDHPCPHDRNASIRWARERLNSRDFVVLDTETTGIGGTKEHEVVRVAVADPDGKILFSSLVKPVGRKRIQPGAQEDHGISMKDLKNAPTIAMLTDDIERACFGKIVVSYNAEFDYGMLNSSCQIAKVKTPKLGNVHCCMLQWSQFVGQLKRNPGDGYIFQKQPGSARGQCSEEDIALTLRCMRSMAEAEEFVPLLSRAAQWIIEQFRLLTNKLRTQ